MRRAVVVGLITASATLVAVPVGAMALASDSSSISTAKTLHLVAPVKGAVTTPTSDLTAFQGIVTSPSGHRLGRLQGYCVTVADDSGAGECTTTIFLAGGQVTLIGPTANRSVQHTFSQAVAGGTGNYQNARGEATVTLQRNKNVDYSVHLIP